MVNMIEVSWGSNSAALHVWKHSCKSTTVSPALPCGKWSDKESDPHGTASDTEIDLHEWSAGSSSHKAANLQLFIDPHDHFYKLIRLCGITWQWDLLKWSRGLMKSHKFIKMHNCHARRHWKSDNQQEENGSQAVGTLYFIWIATSIGYLWVLCTDECW